MMMKFAYESLPLHTSFSIEGKSRKVGQLRPLENLKIPPEKKGTKELKFFFSWVKLAGEEVLDGHYHRVDSFVILAAGRGKVQGDNQLPVTAGDALWIPRDNFHSFCPVDAEGFSGLSLQLSPGYFFQDGEGDGEGEGNLTHYDTSSPAFSHRQKRDVVVISRKSLASPPDCCLFEQFYQGEVPFPLKNYFLKWVPPDQFSLPGPYNVFFSMDVPAVCRFRDGPCLLQPYDTLQLENSPGESVFFEPANRESGYLLWFGKKNVNGSADHL